MLYVRPTIIFIPVVERNDQMFLPDTIGGYQVMKKWLSYREAVLLGRALSNEEAREVQAMARRMAAILLLEPALDANYAAVTATPYAWPGSDR